MLEEGLLTSPDARAAVLSALGLGGGETLELARRALARGDAALAVGWFQDARRAKPALAARDEAQYALALCESAPEAARAIFDARRGQPESVDEVARLAAALCRKGALSFAVADAQLRRACRAAGPHSELTQEANIARAELMAARGEFGRARKLLSRKKEAAASMRPAMRARRLLVLSRALAGQGEVLRAASAARGARELHFGGSLRVEVERQCFAVASRPEKGAAAARWLKAATRELDSGSAREAWQHLSRQEADAAVLSALRPASVAPPEPNAEHLQNLRALASELHALLLRGNRLKQAAAARKLLAALLQTGLVSHSELKTLPGTPREEERHGHHRATRAAASSA
jgi:hypothetical protein